MSGKTSSSVTVGNSLNPVIGTLTAYGGVADAFNTNSISGNALDLEYIIQNQSGNGASINVLRFGGSDPTQGKFTIVDGGHLVLANKGGFNIQNASGALAAAYSVLKNQR